MSSEKSPYKDVGLNGHCVAHQSKRKKIPNPHVYGGVNREQRWRHDWAPSEFKHNKKARLQLCRRCCQPKYIVEAQPCRGRK